MPETYRVQYTHLAVAQLQDILDYIQEVSPQNAVAMINRLLAAVEGLFAWPFQTLAVRLRFARFRSRYVANRKRHRRAK